MPPSAYPYCQQSALNIAYEHKLSLTELLATSPNFINILLVVINVAVEGGAAQVAHPVPLPQRLDNIVIQIVLEELNLQRIVFIVVNTKLSNLL